MLSFALSGTSQTSSVDEPYSFYTGPSLLSLVPSEEDSSSPPGKPKGQLRLLLRDAGIALLFVILILLAMFAYSGLWPPLVVIESNSMMHGDDNTSHIGTIDTGDLVLVKKVDRPNQIETYADGLSNGYRTYGDYGDVIIYKKGGSDVLTPIIHRAMIYLEPNADGQSYRAPSLQNAPTVSWSVFPSTNTWYNLTGQLSLLNVGYDHISVQVDVSNILRYYQLTGATPQAGFITKGDHNPYTDQFYNWGPDPLVKFTWVVGKARGEIPWFGLLKLWNTNSLGSPAPPNSVRDLWIAIALIIATPIVIDVLLAMREKRSRQEKARAEAKDSARRDGPPGTR